MKKNLIILFVSFVFIRCNFDKHHLKWNVEEEQPICYALQSENLDSIEFSFLKDSFNLPRSNSTFYRNSFGESLVIENIIIIENEGDSIEFNLGSYWSPFSKEIKEDIENINVLDILNLFKYGSSGEINVTIDKSGKILRNNKLGLQEKNYTSLLCCLPDKKVAEGDTWPIEILTHDTFSFNKQENVNEVRLDEVKTMQKREIAFISYKIQVFDSFIDKSYFPPSKVTINVNYFGRALFDITKGKWLYFEGVLGQKRMGKNSEQELKYIKLVELTKLSQIDLKIIDLGIDEKLPEFNDIELIHAQDYYGIIRELEYESVFD